MAKVKGNKAVLNTNTEEKIVTKYDKKIAKRQAEEKAAAKTRKITKIVCAAVVAVIVIVAAIMTVNEYNKINREYINIAGEAVNKKEFDFYYNLSKTNILDQSLGENFTYGDYLASYMGYDESKSDSSQTYTDGYSWYDYFANSAIEAMKEYNALGKLADEANFEYNSAEDDYKEFVDDMQKAADEAGQSLDKYYKTVFGKHASQSGLEEYVREYLKAYAYMDVLKKSYTPSDTEIDEYYEKNKDDYDLASYRYLEINASDKTNKDTFTEAKKKAYEMYDVVVDEASFISACTLYAADPTNYKDNKDYSLKVDQRKGNITDDKLADWVFASERIANDKTVIEDDDKGSYIVALYVSRMKDDSASQTISDKLISEKYTEQIEEKTQVMNVDVSKTKITIIK